MFVVLPSDKVRETVGPCHTISPESSAVTTGDIIHLYTPSFSVVPNVYSPSIPGIETFSPTL